MYRVNEIFWSVQGEGISIGRSAIFIRFSGCNLGCSFCDTAHGEYKEYTLLEITNIIKGQLALQGFEIKQGKILDSPGLKCILTGGEPLLQVHPILVSELISIGFEVCVETNGSKGIFSSKRAEPVAKVLDLCSDIVVSPKNKEVSSLALQMATCLKLLFPVSELGLTEEDICDLVEVFHLGCGDKKLVIQPITPVEGKFDKRYFDRCAQAHLWAVERFRNYGEVWRVIPQMHRLIGMR